MHTTIVTKRNKTKKYQSLSLSCCDKNTQNRKTDGSLDQSVLTQKSYYF